MKNTIVALFILFSLPSMGAEKKLVCRGSYSEASFKEDQEIDFAQKLVKKLPEIIYMEGTKSIKTRDGRFKIQGHGSLYEKGFYMIAIEVTDTQTGMVSSTSSTKTESGLFVKEGSAPEIKRVLSITCNIK